MQTIKMSETRLLKLIKTGSAQLAIFYGNFSLDVLNFTVSFNGVQDGSHDGQISVQTDLAKQDRDLFYPNSTMIKQP
jgi:hypothetical protein